MKLSDGWQIRSWMESIPRNQILNTLMKLLLPWLGQRITLILSSKPLILDGLELMLLHLSRNYKTLWLNGLIHTQASFWTIPLRRLEISKNLSQRSQKESKIHQQVLIKNQIKTILWESWLISEMLKWLKIEHFLKLNQWNKLSCFLKSTT